MHLTYRDSYLFTTFMVSTWCLNSLTRFSDVLLASLICLAPRKHVKGLASSGLCVRLKKHQGGWRNNVIFKLTGGDCFWWREPPRKSNPVIARVSGLTYHAGIIPQPPSHSLFSIQLCFVLRAIRSPLNSQDLSWRYLGLQTKTSIDLTSWFLPLVCSCGRQHGPPSGAYHVPGRCQKHSE